jgi:hypothetical protein
LAFDGRFCDLPAGWKITAKDPIECAVPAPCAVPGQLSPVSPSNPFGACSRLILADKTLAFGTRMRQEIPSSWLIGGRGDQTIQAFG